MKVVFVRSKRDTFYYTRWLLNCILITGVQPVNGPAHNRRMITGQNWKVLIIPGEMISLGKVVKLESLVLISLEDDDESDSLWWQVNFSKIWLNNDGYCFSFNRVHFIALS